MGYAKTHVRPKLQSSEEARFAQIYAELRRESTIHIGMPIAVRHLESMIRITEAHAKIHLREHVLPGDMDHAIKVVVDSYIGTLKHTAQRVLQRKFQRSTFYKTDPSEVFLSQLRELVREQLKLKMCSEAQEDEVCDTYINVKVCHLKDRMRAFDVGDIDPL